MNFRESGHERAGQAHRTSWRKRRTPLAVVGAALALVVTGTALAAAGENEGGAAGTKAASGTAAASPGRHKPGPAPLPAPPQMAELSFLLGSFICTYTPPGGKEKVIRMATKRSLNGHYYDALATIPDDNLRSRQVFGWNPGSGEYVLQFHDDWGSVGTAASPPKRDGAYVFKGTYSLVEKPSADGRAKAHEAQVVDVITPGPNGSYTDVQTLTFPASNFTFQLSYACKREKAGHGE
ncbi:hypothetical protein ACH4E8_33205 [Streptomyces sp. NPDC017979]|uniref:hypothetical protein n=1 Tax=Streptomyces sp. NPDC017979 TaxID=3365024 RepID=UPI0037A3C6D1